jgi:hypothetical protein
MLLEVKNFEYGCLFQNFGRGLYTNRGHEFPIFLKVHNVGKLIIELVHVYSFKRVEV